MVRIEKMEMQGFKSFSKKTIISFPSNFSVICGPNGSGKSNVLDALCFVLGRVSAKSMRADKMLEMIFNGGIEKKPADFAKVKLYFDNIDRMFPFEEDTVTLSRKVNRKGISMYKINGKTVTRESVLETLRAARIHPDGYNIILQGDVTEIIEMNPRERREIIDEISGIREFDQKREKAQKELEIVEKRLTNTAIVLGEKESSIKKLDVERRSAKEHKILTSELDKLRASLAKIKLEQAEESMGKLNQKLDQAEIKQLEDKLNKIDNDIENLEKEKSKISEKVFERKDIEIIKKVEHLKSEIDSKMNKIDKNNFEMQRLDEAIKRLELMQIDSGNRIVDSVLKLKKSGVYGTVASLMSVHNKHQTAIEVAGGNHLNDIITHDKELAIECLNYLKANKIGRATFLPLDKIQPRDNRSSKNLLNEPGVVGIAIDLIDFDQKYYNAFSFVLGDTLVVNKIEDAKRIGIGKARYVTLDGDLVEKSGAIIGGYYRANRKMFSGSEINDYNKLKEKLKSEITILESEIGELNKQLGAMKTEEKSETNEIIEIKKQTLEIDNKIMELRKKRKTIYDQRIIAEDELNKLRINRARLEAALDNIKSEFENYKNKETYDMKPEVLESKINESLKKINSLGLINQRALEEYDQQKIIYDDLKQKVDKLTEERNRVFSMMGEIEGKRRECFMKTFKSVAMHFKTVFSDLTGGVGELELQDPEDIESGLIIKASPARKKLLNIDLLSGGEKTLAALAFLFAVQQFSPAPFYVLDEIDAALDKVNTKKITELVKKYSDRAEFIVITHNDTTIQQADVVYGVSMDGGESTLVSIRMPQ